MNTTETNPYGDQQPQPLSIETFVVPILVLLTIILIYHAGICLGRMVRAVYRFLSITFRYFAVKWEEGRDDVREVV